MRIANLAHPELTIDSLTIQASESWCLYGDNNSGLDVLADILSGTSESYSADLLDLQQGTGVISFSRQQEQYEEELRQDDSDFLDRPDPGTLVRELLPPELEPELLEIFAMKPLLDQGIRQLSSGQTRKLLLLAELGEAPACLILQNPQDGLDNQSICELEIILEKLWQRGMTIVLLVNNRSDIPDWCQNLAYFHDGKLVTAGKKDDMSAILSTRSTQQSTAEWLQDGVENNNTVAELVRLTDGWAAYGEKRVFSGLNLQISTGEHTLITGPNGCGKSTLIEMITGDNQNCYRNELFLFGHRRGTGESIWDIKKQMGIISPSLHRDYRVSASSLQVVLSGLYDSIGLYDPVVSGQIRYARELLDWFGLTKYSERSFRSLTFARQRLLLIARGLIKAPKLLILDEPTQGLDDIWRQRILDIFDQIDSRKLSTMLFISHRQDEFRPCFKHHIQMETYQERESPGSIK